MARVKSSGAFTLRLYRLLRVPIQKFNQGALIFKIEDRGRIVFSVLGLP